MKLRALIVDDEYPARQELRTGLSKIDGVEVVGEATNAAEALQLISALDYSILFLDIEMPGMSGIELGRVIQKIDKKPYLVYVTAYENYALQAFEVSAVDYLLKPFDEKRLKQTIDKIQKLITTKKASTGETSAKPGQGQPKPERIPVEKFGKTLLVDPDDIIYAFIQDENVVIKLYDEEVRSRFTLKELEEKLDPHIFFRVHRSYIVNIKKIKEIIPFFNNTYTLIVDDKVKSEVRVSRNQTKRLKDFLGI